MMKTIPIISLLVILYMSFTIGRKDKELYCGACHMLVDEISWEIENTDAKKTIQVGSFRINPDGTQRLNEIPFKRSEVQLTEAVESACLKSNDYFQVGEGERKLFRRQNRRDGKPSKASNIMISKDSQKMLKFACETIIEDHEDEIIQVFKDENNPSYLKSVCVSITGSCSGNDLYDVEPDESVEEDIEEGSDDNQSDGDDSVESSDEVDDDDEINDRQTDTKTEL